MSDNENPAIIRLKPLHHHNKVYIGLYFDYDRDLINAVKLIPNRKYSKTHGCWYLPSTKESLIYLREQRMNVIIEEPLYIGTKNKQTDERILKQSIKPSIDKPILDRIYLMQRYLEQARYSDSTVKTYTSMVKQFFSRNLNIQWDAITYNNIEMYNHSEFIQKKRSNSTQSQFISAMKIFYRINDHPELIPDQIERPKREKRLPNVLTKAEVKKIILSARNIKHKCLLSILYGGGLRIGEALNLRVEDVRRKEKLLYIRSGKGKKDRRVPLSATMDKLIIEYKQAYNPGIYLFEGLKGGKYSPRSAQQVLKRCCSVAGIKIRVTLHTLRHSYATHLLEAGVGIRYIQEILGHKNPKTTMVYTHVSGKKLGEVRSPLEDLKI